MVMCSEINDSKSAVVVGWFPKQVVEYLCMHEQWARGSDCLCTIHIGWPGYEAILGYALARFSRFFVLTEAKQDSWPELVIRLLIYSITVTTAGLD